MKFYTVTLLVSATAAIRNPNFPSAEEVAIDTKLKKAFADQDAASWKAKKDAKGPLVLQAEAKAKNDAEVAKVQKYVTDNMAKEQAAKNKADDAYIAAFKAKVDPVANAMAAASNGTLGSPPLPPLPKETEYQKILNGANVSTPVYKEMKKDMEYFTKATDKKGGDKKADAATPAEAPKADAAVPKADAAAAPKAEATATPAAPAK